MNNAKFIINAPQEIINAMRNAPDMPTSFYKEASAALELMRQEGLSNGLSKEEVEKELMGLALHDFYRVAKEYCAVSDIQAHGIALRVFLRVMGINPDEYAVKQIH